MRRLLFVIILLLAGARLGATTYYVAATGGDDARSCATAQTHTTPKLTIDSGIGCLSAGDTLEIKTGTYTVGIRSSVGNQIPNGAAWASATTIGSYQSDVVTLRPSGLSNVLDYSNAAAKAYIVFDGLVFDGVNNDQTTANVIFIGTTNNHIRISNSTVRNGGNNCILVNGSFNEFISNTIQDCGDNNVTSAAYGIYGVGDDNLIERNTILSNSGYGIHIYNSGGGPDRAIVRYNTVHDNGSFSGSQAGILLSQGDGHQAYNNIVYDEAEGGILVALFATNAKVYNNTVYSCGGIGIEIQAEATGTTLKNNISYSNVTNLTDNGVSTTKSNNSTDGTNPNFVDPGTFNFRLQATSACCLNTAVNLTAVFTDDFYGNARPAAAEWDIGAHEFIPADSPPTQCSPTSPVFDDTTRFQNFNNTSISFAHTVTGSQPLIFAFLCTYNFGGDFIPGTFSNVQYAGAAMTQIATEPVPGLSNMRCELWYKLNPATGANNVTATLSVGGSAVEAYAHSVTGVNQTTPLGTVVEEADDDFADTNSITLASATGELGVDFIAQSNNAGGDTFAATATDQTKREGGGNNFIIATSTAPGTASREMTWEWDDAGSYIQMGVPVKGTPCPSGNNSLIMTGSGF